MGTHSIRRVVAGLASILLLSLGAAAGDKVVVPVIVTDDSGAAVAGLGPADFSVRLPKRARLEGVHQVAPLTSGQHAQEIPIVILVEADSIPVLALPRAEKEVLEFLATAAANDEPVTVVVNTGEKLVVAHDSSTDSKVLAAAVAQLLEKKPATSAAQDAEFEKQVATEVTRLQELTPERLGPPASIWAVTLRQLAGLQRLASFLQRAPGRKAILWISAQFPVEISGGELTLDTFSSDSGMGTELKNVTLAFQSAVNALNSASVSVFALQVQLSQTTLGMRAGLPGSSERTSIGLGLLARATGGVSLPSTSPLSDAAQATKKNMGVYYLLDLDVDPTRRDPEWTSIRVKLEHPGVKLHYCSGFFALPFHTGPPNP